MAKETKKKSKTGRIVLLVIALVLILGVLIFGNVYFYNKYSKFSNFRPSQFNEFYTGKILEKVAKLTQLPKDEEPSQILEIKDKNDPSLDKSVQEVAENGDVLIIYIKTKTAILYRPSKNIVVKTFPLSEQQAEITSSKTSATKVKIIGGATARESVATTLLEKLKDQVSITEKTDAVGAYTTITVVDLTGKNPGKAADLAAALGGTVGELPAGETAPANADILIVTSTN